MDVAPMEKEEIKAPREVVWLLEANKEVMDRFDKELGQAKTVSMKIDTGEHPPVKLKPYRVPLHRKIWWNRPSKRCWTQKL